jgi:serine protease inhibitor
MPQLAPPRHHAGFTLDVFRLLAGRDPADNVAWSPYSVTAALQLAAAGARGRTLAEIAAVAGEPAETAGLLARASTADGVEVANTLWVDSGLDVLPAYESTLRDRRDARIAAADFPGDADRARELINADVEETTHGWIRHLLPPGTVDTGTRAVIVNALWARVPWLAEFDRENTRVLPFHTPRGRREVPTMSRRGRLAYAAAGGWRLVTLPSCGIQELSGPDGRTVKVVNPGDLVFDVFLPEGARSAGSFEAGGAPGAALLRELYDSARHELVDLRLPRFGVASGAGLGSVLRRLGVRALFTDGADLSGISGQPLRVDEVIHRAVLTVDEKGAEGSAATAMVAPGGAAVPAPSEPIAMHVDRPFLAMVRHQPTGVIYFMARVTEP